jgi:hypothetical protein
MQTRREDEDIIKEKYTEREGAQDLENIMGDLFIAQFQVNKLRSLLGDIFGVTMDEKETSTHVFGYNHKWYKISIRIDKVK